MRDFGALEVLLQKSCGYLFLVDTGSLLSGYRAHRTPSQAHTPTQISHNVLCPPRWHKQTSLQS